MRFAACQARVSRLVIADSMQHKLRTPGTAKDIAKIPARPGVSRLGTTHDPSAPPALRFCAGRAFKTHPQSTHAPAKHARLSP